MASPRSSRTERPTPKRILEARKEGRTGKSQDVGGALGMLALIGFFSIFGRDYFLRLADFSKRFFDLDRLGATDLTNDDLAVVLREAALAGPGLIFPPVLILAVVSVGAQVVQTPPLFTLKPLKPDLSKLNPIKGLGKLIQGKAWIDLAKAMLKVALVVTIGWLMLQSILAGEYAAGADVGETVATLATIARSMFLRVAILMLGLALADVMVQRWQHYRSLRMTKQEIKDERRQAEGDPLIKQRQRGKMMEVSRNRMIADVADASVVITNPTHYAVALEYDQDGTGVPRVLAKGIDHMARRIREAATEHGVPIHRDPPLARALHRICDVGEFIPESLYLAVAEILALVLRRRPEGAR